jgi:SAM-dependent methyltransferase
VDGFTAHNIVLPDGTQTMPGVPPVADGGICRAVLRTFGLFLRPGDRVADLGCLEGGYAAALAAAGYDVLGVEARTRNYARCEYVRERLGLPNLRFTRDDARNLADHGEFGGFGGVLCCGLLYHLDRPSGFLAMLGKVTRKVLIVQSHYSAVPRSEHEGRRGQWEHDSPAEDTPWGSHGNSSSFWLGRPDLLAAMHDAGFGCVFEQHDYKTSIAGGLYVDQLGNAETSRGMFTGVKP